MCDVGHTRYLEEEVKTAQNNPDYQPWKPNCQLTPTATDIILGRLKKFQNRK